MFVDELRQALEARMRASDIMTLGAASIHPAAPIEEAARLMLRHRISGLPVVDDSGNLVGIVTERDLLRQKGDSADDRPQWLELLLGSEGWGEGAKAARLLTVADVMSPNVETVGEDTPVQEIAERMQRHGIKRLPVVKDGKVRGIVSRADLLRGLAQQAEDMPSASAEDRALRRSVVSALSQGPKPSWSSINVVVRDGTVELRGATTDAALRERVVATARAVPGVKAVDDRLVLLGPGSGRP